MITTLYSDSLIQITDETILFRTCYFPFGAKNLELSKIAHVEVLKPTFMNGKWRIHGSGDFRTWFPRDVNRPGRDFIFLLHLKNKWRRIGFTAENSEAVTQIFEEKNIPVQYQKTGITND